ncbi:TetR/AcrR family transcriptional regulator [Pseudomonas cichorii]|uniref:TetR/AcrR family transcriptional regulator n=1 Tax=Pseudomonas cichorii TaxID=36746 RepID=UPI0022A78A5A|nr:TetR/AcrR family transcriptional regulator [Pseudomonas cichorii]
MRSARNILEAAAVLFSEKGIAETSVDDIVLRAGSSKGTFYHHYESKSALLAALRQSVVDEFEADLDAVLETRAGQDPDVRLDAWVSAACDWYIRSADQLHDIAWSNYPGSRWTVGNTRIITGLTDLLIQGQKKGIFVVNNPHSTATFILRGMLGAIDDLILSEKSLKEIKPEMVALARRSVGLP